MAQRDRAGTLELTREERTHLDLSAARHDLSQSLTRQITFLVKQMNLTPDEAAAWVRESAGIQPEEQESEQISWFEISRLMETDPERGERVWQRIKDDALLELQQGARSSRTIEPKVNPRPIDRARFSAIVHALVKSLQPRDPLEELLIHQMGCAYELHLHWQDRASLREQEEEWEGDRDRRSAIRNMSARDRERYSLDNGWMPPRVSTAAAIDQSVMIADRYQRSFLRLLKAYRDNRRLFATLVVTGGQVNVGEQQVNVIVADPDEVGE